jgi:hypothetical protein
MSIAATLYLNHPDRERINFCWIIGSHLYWKPGRWEKMRGRLLETCILQNYQKVLNGRPLIYFYNTGITESEENIQTCRERLRDLNSSLIDAGGKRPYYVFMGWDISDWPKAQKAGFHAWSFYAGGGIGTYADASYQVRRARWEIPEEEGIPLVPVVSTGWNRMPRFAYQAAHGKVPWWDEDAYPPDKADQNVELPEPFEISAHLADAIGFAKMHTVCKARTCIIYAWNEHSEGGWICPTVTRDGGIDSSRVMAVRKGLEYNK